MQAGTLRFPSPLGLISCKAFIGHREALCRQADPGQTWRRHSSYSKKGGGQRLIVGAGRFKAKPSDDFDSEDM